MLCSKTSCKSLKMRRLKWQQSSLWKEIYVGVRVVQTKRFYSFPFIKGLVDDVLHPPATIESKEY